MDQKNKTFSCVLRSLGRMSDGAEINLKVDAEEKNFELNPSFSFDMETSNKLIRQGMIRDTLRAILQTAVSTPLAVLNIDDNLKRIFVIKHADEDNHKQREKL
ncbi:hypothetical protein BGZ74_010977 [Mortierella antarctica]|nr:hypothetical protein BGZ74_010977 [Mortierella antarctica]